MNHIVSKTTNGKTLSIAAGDTITITLPYDDRRESLTAWTFAEDFSFNACLSLNNIDSTDGIRSMIFKAHTPGTVQIALHQYFVLGFGESNVTDRFKLNVTVA
jgi:hypothetical protein